MTFDSTSRDLPFRWAQVDARRHADDSPRLSNVFRQWHEDRGPAIMPRWRISLLEAMPAEAIPFVNVIDVNDGKLPFSYRFFGSGLANMHLFELTNKTTSAIEPAGFRQLCEDQHLMTIERREPMMFANEVLTRTDGLFMTHLMLRLPYAEDDETVSQILTIEDALGDPEEVWEQFRRDRV